MGELNKKAKAVSTSLGADMKKIFERANEEMMKDLRQSVTKNLQDSFGPMDDLKEKMVSQMVDTLKLANRGVETKMQQKKDEAIKELLAGELREARKKLEQKDKKEL